MHTFTDDEVEYVRTALLMQRDEITKLRAYKQVAKRNLTYLNRALRLARLEAQAKHSPVIIEHFDRTPPRFLVRGSTPVVPLGMQGPPVQLELPLEEC
jgi:hypothetical protein